MTPLRAFPLRIAPRPGESLDSWLEATAVRLRVTMAELYEAMGFASPHSELWRHIVLWPTDTELAAISITTGLPPEQVRAMTLTR
jgi:TniQ